MDGLDPTPPPRFQEPDSRSAILVAEDDDDLRELVGDRMRMAGFLVAEVSNGLDAIALIGNQHFDLAILDVDMPGASGYEVLDALNQLPEAERAPAILLTAQATPRDVVEGLERGADDHIGKPFNARVLTARVASALRHKEMKDELRSRADELEILAHTDVLTGLPNRRELELSLRSMAAASIRHNQPLSALMIDIDHFKSVNDRYGHDVGDEVLRAVARTMQDVLRGGDIVGRWGGEEFLALLPMTNSIGAKRLAERLRSAIKDGMTVTGDTLKAAAVTISVGCAERDDTPSNMVAAADAALYRAKAEGRDRVVVVTSGDQ